MVSQMFPPGTPPIPSSFLSGSQAGILLVGRPRSTACREVASCSGRCVAEA